MRRLNVVVGDRGQTILGYPPAMAVGVVEAIRPDACVACWRIQMKGLRRDQAAFMSSSESALIGWQKAGRCHNSTEQKRYGGSTPKLDRDLKGHERGDSPRIAANSASANQRIGTIERKLALRHRE
jgi:hypothetical protein